MPDIPLEVQVERLSLDLAARQTKCYREHVTPLLKLMNLPIGTVITREYSGMEQMEYWEIQICEDHYRGVDIIELLSKLPS